MDYFEKLEHDAEQSRLDDAIERRARMRETAVGESTMRKTVCVDLDGVLAHYDGWKGDNHIGLPISGAVRFIRALSDFARVLIHTSRTELDPVVAWLDKHAFDYHGIWKLPGKPMAVAYVDDRAVICRPTKDVENYDFDRALRECRAFVDRHELGLQGTHSKGRIDDDDEGDLKMIVTTWRNCVRVDFGKPVGWLALPKHEAAEFASLILKHSEKLQ
jgi:hypothetical protein